jgi:hypothetical protein
MNSELARELVGSTSRHQNQSNVCQTVVEECVKFGLKGLFNFYGIGFGELMVLLFLQLGFRSISLKFVTE